VRYEGCIVDFTALAGVTLVRESERGFGAREATREWVGSRVG
jgi:hypothetical protein